MTASTKRRTTVVLLLLLAVITCFICGWRLFQPPQEENRRVGAVASVDVKPATNVVGKCCECDKKVVRHKPVVKKKKKAYVAPAVVIKKNLVPPVVAASPPKTEEKKAEPKVEEKKPEPASAPPKVAEMKCVAPNIRQLMDDGSIACVQPPAAPVSVVAKAPEPVAQPQYQLGSACSLSDGAQGIVTYIYPNGNLRCSEVVLVPVPSKLKASAQYLVCTAAGAAVGYYHGGTYSAISGGVGGAGGTYVGREIWGENGGWLGCATGTAAGLIKWPDARRRGASATATATTSPSGGGAGIGETVVGGGGGLN